MAEKHIRGWLYKHSKTCDSLKHKARLSRSKCFDSAPLKEADLCEPSCTPSCQPECEPVDPCYSSTNSDYKPCLPERPLYDIRDSDCNDTNEDQAAYDDNFNYAVTLDPMDSSDQNERLQDPNYYADFDLNEPNQNHNDCSAAARSNRKSRFFNTDDPKTRHSIKVYFDKAGFRFRTENGVVYFDMQSSPIRVVDTLEEVILQHHKSRTSKVYVAPTESVCLEIDADSMSIIDLYKLLTDTNVWCNQEINTFATMAAELETSADMSAIICGNRDITIGISYNYNGGCCKVTNVEPSYKVEQAREKFNTKEHRVTQASWWSLIVFFTMFFRRTLGVDILHIWIVTLLECVSLGLIGVYVWCQLDREYRVEKIAE